MIRNVFAREVFDSRGNPTVEVEVKTGNGSFRAMVPSGASTGSHEALELRDGGDRLSGKGVKNAVRNVNDEISKAVNGMDETDQKAVDYKMLDLDGTDSKSRLGANAILGVSMAVCRAGAFGKPLYKHISDIAETKMRMPIPQLNVINGGKHAGYDNDIQEYLLLPVGAKDFPSGFTECVELYHDLKAELKKRFGPQATHLGDEGGFVPPLPTPEERLDVLTKLIERRGSQDIVKLGIDAASSEFFKDGTYTIGDRKMNAGELVDYYADLVKTYPIASIEDGMDEDDWDGWKQLMSRLGGRIQLVGDDMLVTNPERIRKAADQNAANSLLLKVNQIGSVTESLEAAGIATKHDWNVVVSHRSGETEDSFIADLATGIGASQIKTGAPARSERLAKYNQLLRIGSEIELSYAGKDF